MIDSVGNVWFVGPFELASAPGTTQVGLLRAVYKPAAFSYRIEVVVKQGDVFAGRNSGRHYRSASSRWPGPRRSRRARRGRATSPRSAFENQSMTGLSTSDAATLGGIVFEAAITYDVNNDGSTCPRAPPPAAPTRTTTSCSTWVPRVGLRRQRHSRRRRDRRRYRDRRQRQRYPGLVRGPSPARRSASATAAARPARAATTAPSGANAGCLSSLGVGGSLRRERATPASRNDTIVLHGTQHAEQLGALLPGHDPAERRQRAPPSVTACVARRADRRLGTKTNARRHVAVPGRRAAPVCVKGVVDVARNAHATRLVPQRRGVLHAVDVQPDERTAAQLDAVRATR